MAYFVQLVSNLVVWIWSYRASMCSTDIPVQQHPSVKYQSSFHCIPADNQYQTHLMLLVIPTALKMRDWLIVTNLNNTDF